MDTLQHWIFDRFLPQNLRARSSKTRQQYQYAVNDFARHLGRQPLLSDLTDDRLAELMGYLLVTRGLAEITANERIGRLKTFWNWAAKKRHVEQFPTICRVPVPDRLPQAWRKDDLAKLFAACRARKGTVAGIPAGQWWSTLNLWLWYTAERIDASLALRIDHLQLDEAAASLPASIRKGRRRAAVYALPSDLVDALRAILPPCGPPRALVFPWLLDRTSFYLHHRQILRAAGLPTGRHCGPHRMRVSHATHRHLAGGDATAALGHSSPATTRKSYLDRAMIQGAAEPLFRPW